MGDYLLIDGSYYCFYRYHALKQWWGFAKKDFPLDEHHTEFLEKFREVFVKKLLELPKALKLDKPTIIVGKDCPRKDIWRMEIYPEYKGNRNSEVDSLLKEEVAYLSVPELVRKYIETMRAQSDNATTLRYYDPSNW